MIGISKLRTWAEINLAALHHNIGVVRRSTPCSIMAVLKAGAYGHGLEAIARELDQVGLAFFGVANVGEARRIAQAGCRTRVYLLGPTLPSEREEVVDQNWTPSLSDLVEAKHFNELAQLAGKTIKVHLTLDTGMGRGGFLPKDIASQLTDLKSLSNLEIEGVGSHLPSADEDREFTEKQFAHFETTVATIERRSSLKFKHLANSAGLLDYPPGCCNLVRPGLMLYGISPLPSHASDLRPTLVLKSRVTLVRQLPAGHGISYGRSFVANRPMRVATVGIGYGDGYPRHLSGKNAEVFLHGKRCPLLGRITMDQIMIEVSQLGQVMPGDEVELFGNQIPIAEIAQKADTIPWEILTGIGARVVRIYKNQ